MKRHRSTFRRQWSWPIALAALTLFGFIHSVDPRGGIYLPWELAGLPKVIMWQFAGAYAALAVLLGLLSLQKPEERPTA